LLRSASFNIVTCKPPGPIESPKLYAPKLSGNYHLILFRALRIDRRTFPVRRARAFDRKGLNVFKFRRIGFGKGGMFFINGGE
jgi:hypothetical protein